MKIPNAIGHAREVSSNERAAQSQVGEDDRVRRGKNLADGGTTESIKQAQMQVNKLIES
jgi:hypothetical protein